jgi:hypothetical protein
MKRLAPLVLGLGLLVLAGPVSAGVVGRFSFPGVAVVAPAPAPWYPYSYYGPPADYPYYPPPPVYSGYGYGYGFGNHWPGVWGTTFYWDSTEPHIRGYTLH